MITIEIKNNRTGEALAFRPNDLLGICIINDSHEEHNSYADISVILHHYLNGMLKTKDAISRECPITELRIEELMNMCK